MGYDFGASIQKIVDGIISFIPNLIVAVVIFLVTLYLGRLGFRAVQAALKRRQTDPEVRLLLARLAQWAIIIFGTIWALAQVNFDITGFVAGLGIIGFTIGFALKDIAENFVAGILLLLQQPFDIGDVVEVNDYNGTVVDIEIRSTTIRTADGLLVIIPNAAVYGNPITNYSRIDKRRIGITVGVDYESDLQKVTGALLTVANSLPGLKREPAPAVVFKEFGDSAINVTLYFWIDTKETDYFKALDAGIKGIKTAFERDHIDIPFGIRKVYMQPVADGR